MIYLDSAATSFIKPKSVRRAMLEAMNTMSSPGRGAYRAAMRAADKVYECREAACRLFNFPSPERVVFTMNATHALNIAIRTLAKNASRAVISGYEHNSVTRAVKASGVSVSVAAGALFDESSVLCEFEKELDGADFAVVNHVSNVFGFVQPVYDISRMCRERGVPLIVDASQSAGCDRVDAAELNAAFIAMPGHKGLLGPQGTGILLCGETPEPLLCGGTGSDSILQTMPDYLPDRAEAGTHNVVGIAGLCEGIKFVISRGAPVIGRHEKRLCAIAAERLSRIDGLELFSGSSQAGVLSIRRAGLDCERFCELLGRGGVAARCGLHCAPLAHKTAGTLDTGTVRLSFSPFTAEKDINAACRIIKAAALEI